MFFFHCFLTIQLHCLQKSKIMIFMHTSESWKLSNTLVSGAKFPVVIVCILGPVTEGVSARDKNNIDLFSSYFF